MTILDLANLERVNGKFYDFVDADKTWDYHYEKTWKTVYEANNLNDPQDITTRSKCVKAYKFAKEQYITYIFHYKLNNFTF